MTIPGSSVIVEGHAIVSANGMISDAAGGMPPAMRNEADWRLFQAALDRAALVVIGRVGHERHPNRGRRRLVTTRKVADLAPDPGDSLATLWNPAGVSIDRALTQLGIADGVLAITGGAAAFDLFLPLYDRFALAEVPDLFIPDGRPCFSGGLPAIALKSAGLGARERAIIDPAAGVTLTMWTR